MSEIFLKCDQSADSAVPVLKRMDPLKLIMKTDDILNRYRRQRIVI